MTEDAGRLLQQVKETRDVGVVHALWSSDRNVQHPDDIARRAGLGVLGDRWLALSPTQAEQVLAAVLHQDLAYDGEIMSAHMAKDLARRVVHLLQPPFEVRWFSNRTLSRSYAYTPITGATFESGIVGVGVGAGLLLWFEDED